MEKNNDIFETVNNHERQAKINRKYSERIKRSNLRILNTAIASAVVSLLCGIMGVTGAMHILIAYPVFSFCGILAAFLFGRWFENGKCLGWK
jgi:hypothetical protein